MFEDIHQMTEWLILMESKLQPHPLTVGDVAQVKSALDDIEVRSFSELVIMSYDRLCYYYYSLNYSKPENCSVCPTLLS